MQFNSRKQLGDASIYVLLYMCDKSHSFKTASSQNCCTLRTITNVALAYLESKQSREVIFLKHLIAHSSSRQTIECTFPFWFCIICAVIYYINAVCFLWVSSCNCLLQTQKLTFLLLLSFVLLEMALKRGSLPHAIETRQERVVTLFLKQ